MDEFNNGNKGFCNLLLNTLPIKLNDLVAIVFVKVAAKVFFFAFANLL